MTPAHDWYHHVKERMTGIMDEWKGYLDVLASKAPVPGGGGASAICAALGAALGEMVGNLTTGKKKYAEWEDKTKDSIESLKELREWFVKLSEEDAQVFEPLSKAYGIKAETEEEKKAKEEYMETYLDAAAQVPLKIMEACRLAMTDMEFFANYGSRLAVSDAGVGAQFLRSGLLGAALNVYINTKLMKDRERAEELNRKARALASEGSAAADRIYEIVQKAVSA